MLPDVDDLQLDVAPLMLIFEFRDQESPTKPIVFWAGGGSGCGWSAAHSEELDSRKQATMVRRNVMV